jgi:hypothetical protein
MKFFLIRPETFYLISRNLIHIFTGSICKDLSDENNPANH